MKSIILYTFFGVALLSNSVNASDECDKIQANCVVLESACLLEFDFDEGVDAHGICSKLANKECCPQMQANGCGSQGKYCSGDKKLMKIFKNNEKYVVLLYYFIIYYFVFLATVVRVHCLDLIARLSNKTVWTRKKNIVNLAIASVAAKCRHMNARWIKNNIANSCCKFVM